MNHDTIPENWMDDQRCILVVDDDPDIRRLVSLRLETEGYDIFEAGSGEHALEIIGRSGLPNLAIVDINMPGMDGIEFCIKVQRFADLPVIMLTSEDRPDTVVDVIEHYAEDYIVKPFNPNELVVRVRRLLRRISDGRRQAQSPINLDARLAVDFAQQVVVVDEATVQLTPTETKLLYLLYRNAGHTVTSLFLLARLWPREEIFYGIGIAARNPARILAPEG